MVSRISVIGLGYIGLPTAAVFADAGVEVVGVEVNDAAIASINAGEPHIVEPHLGALLRRVVEAGKLRATKYAEEAEVFIVAVPTPFKNDHEPDLSYIEAAAKGIAPKLKKGNLVILESTSPVGATEKMAAWMAEERPDLSFPQQKGEMSDIRVAHCPERVLPGKILQEVVENDRVVGGMTRRCASAAVQLYRIVVKGECHVTDARTAEMAKLTENAFRDVNIAFANELSTICDKLKINVWQLIRMANLHPRVNILSPGPGVGGHCIAVDPWFIVHSAPEEAKLIRAAREINDSKPDWVVNKVLSKASTIKNPTIACFGLAFKPNVDDLRESPAMEVTTKLAQSNAGKILAVEPHISGLPPAFRDSGVELTDFHVALDSADIALLLVDHDAFQHVDRDLVKDKILIDTRGTW